MKDSMMILYDRTLRNCQYYESKNDIPNLIAEIGCLRGIAYCLQVCGTDPLTLPELVRYIYISNERKESLA